MEDFITKSTEPTYTNQIHIWWMYKKHLTELSRFLDREHMTGKERVRIHHYTRKVEDIIHKLQKSASIEFIEVPPINYQEYRDGEGY